MYWLIYVLAFHSNASAVSILGCPRWLLLSLFIKHNNAPKCDVAWFHEGAYLLDSFENCSLIECVRHANIHQKRQSIMNLPPVETYPSSICYHQPSWELSNRPGMPLTAHSKRLIVVCSTFSSISSSHLSNQIVKRNALELSMMFNLSPIFMRWSAPLSFKTDSPTVSLGRCILPTFIQIQLCDNIDQKS